MSQRKPKKLTLIEHTARRARERYGRPLPTCQQNAIVNLIQNQKSTIVEKQSCRVSKHLVKFEGVDWYVVYDNQRKTLVTVLPPDAPEIQSLVRQTENI